MDVESCELVVGGEVREMWFLKWKRMILVDVFSLEGGGYRESGGGG